MKKSEQLNIKTSADEQTNNDYLYKIEHVENTPFSIVEKDDEYFGVIGNRRITDVYKVKSALEIELEQVDWNKVIQVIYTIVEQYEKVKQNNNN